MNHPMIVTSLAAMLLATGCTTMAPDYRQPALPVAGQFPDSVGATRPEGSVSDTLLADWRAFFPDEQLKMLIELALTHNRDLRVAALQIDKARARYQIQRADLLPSIAASAWRTPAIGWPVASTMHSISSHSASAAALSSTQVCPVFRASPSVLAA